MAYNFYEKQCAYNPFNFFCFCFCFCFFVFFLLKDTRESFNNSSMQIKTLDGINSINSTKSGFQLSVEGNFAFALVLYYYALGLVNKTRATFSTNGNPHQNQSCFCRTRFPALGTSYMYLLRILISKPKFH